MPQAKKQSWRLKKTLSRNVDFRPIEDDDVKFAWAAYKKGGLPQMFAGEDMKATEFRDAFSQTVVSGYNAAWTILADTKNGFVPIGIVLANWHPVEAKIMLTTGIAWFPWASPRNIIEGTIKFFNEIRREIPMIGYARPHQKRLYEVCLKHGIMRRIGTAHTVFDEPATLFETRTP